MAGEDMHRPGLIAGFHLTARQRTLVVVLGLAILGFAFYQWFAQGSSNIALAAVVLGGLFVLIGLAGILGVRRMTFQRADMKISFEPPEEADRQEMDEPARAAPMPKEPPDARREELDTSSSVEARKEPALNQAVRAYVEKDYARFDQLLKDAASDEDSEDERLRLESMRLGWLYNIGQTAKLEQLEALRDAHPTSPHPVRQLGNCYAFAGEHVTAAKWYQEGTRIAGLDETERLSLSLLQAGSLGEAGHFQEAQDLLTAQFQEVSDEGKTTLHVNLALLYEKWDKKDLMNWHLEKALEADPGDIRSRFTLAYSYSESGHPHAAFYHYDLIRRKDTGALNNIAVLLSEFDMPITSADHYRRAAEQKHTLAAANLARKMIRAGLADEAKRVLEGALKETEVDEAVHRAASQLASDRSEEEKRLAKIREGAKGERELCRKRVEAERDLASPVTPGHIVGTWKTTLGDMNFQLDGGNLVARFEVDIWHWVLTGETAGRTYSFKWKCDHPGQNDEGDGFFLFPSNDTFEGLVRNTPQKGEVRLVSGGGRQDAKADAASEAPPDMEAIRQLVRRVQKRPPEGGQGQAD